MPSEEDVLGWCTPKWYALKNGHFKTFPDPLLSGWTWAHSESIRSLTFKGAHFVVRFQSEKMYIRRNLGHNKKWIRSRSGPVAKRWTPDLEKRRAKGRAFGLSSRATETWWFCLFLGVNLDRSLEGSYGKSPRDRILERKSSSDRLAGQL